MPAERISWLAAYCGGAKNGGLSDGPYPALCSHLPRDVRRGTHRDRVGLGDAADTRDPAPFEAPGVIDCGNFQDNFVDFFNGTQTTFYDTGGDPVRLVQHVEHSSNDVNSATGLTIHEHGHFTFTIDLIAETVTITGNQEVANRQGAGVVVQDVGRAVFDFDDNLLFFAGGRNHSELFGGDQVLCDALS